MLDRIGQRIAFDICCSQLTGNDRIFLGVDRAVGQHGRIVHGQHVNHDGPLILGAIRSRGAEGERIDPVEVFIGRIGECAVGVQDNTAVFRWRLQFKHDTAFATGIDGAGNGPVDANILGPLNRDVIGLERRQVGRLIAKAETAAIVAALARAVVRRNDDRFVNLIDVALPTGVS